ncbi:interferon gamma receptor 2 [Macrotis lagotis]|uniref:interferon gamma receptor 2 n=1 Tax=Macrotis lagotis TaxID=92651 RepID=UPI003D68070F
MVENKELRGYYKLGKETGGAGAVRGGAGRGGAGRDIPEGRSASGKPLAGALTRRPLPLPRSSVGGPGASAPAEGDGRGRSGEGSPRRSGGEGRGALSRSPGPRPAEAPPGAMQALLGLLLLLLCACGPSCPPALAELLTHLPAPQNPRIHLYNLEQVLIWDPVPISNLTGPVLYSVEYKYLSNNWSKVHCVNCTRIAEPICNFTAARSPGCFPYYFNVLLRVKAELGELVSDWASVPQFRHLQSATIGPPLDVIVRPALNGSLIISFQPPFKEEFQCYVYYWEKDGGKKVELGPFICQSIQLNDLKVASEYCFQVQAELFFEGKGRRGQLSNVFCHKTSAKASAKLQQNIIIILSVITTLILLVLIYYILVPYFQRLIKNYFHSPGIPSQIKEYLRDPNEPILEALDKNNLVEEDCWVSLSIVSCTEDNHGVFSSNLSNICMDNQSHANMT